MRNDFNLHLDLGEPVQQTSRVMINHRPRWWQKAKTADEMDAKTSNGAGFQTARNDWHDLTAAFASRHGGSRRPAA
jgi:hypothetical protein